MSASTRKKRSSTPAADTAAKMLEVQPRARGARQRRRGMSAALKVGLVLAGAVLVLGVIFFANNRGGGNANYPFAVGKPGPGEVAPQISLPSTNGAAFDLGALRGQTVLIYFQEGIGCEPCWDQLKDIEAHASEIKALGIDTIVSITTDPIDALRQKAADEKITTAILSDHDLSVSKAYDANSYGMMGSAKDGHSFILVGKDGVIKWRADYGGSPNYTMRVPVDHLLVDVKKGVQDGGA